MESYANNISFPNTAPVLKSFSHFKTQLYEQGINYGE